MICDNCKIEKVCKLTNYINELKKYGKVNYIDCKFKIEINAEDKDQPTQKARDFTETFPIKFKDFKDFKDNKDKTKRKKIKCSNCNENIYEDEIKHCAICNKTICNLCSVSDMKSNRILCEECWDKQ